MIPVIADIPPITKQYKPFTKEAIEHVFVSDAFQSHTMRLNDYLTFTHLYPIGTFRPSKIIPSIEKRFNEITFLGIWDITNQENRLSPSEVNSMSMLNGSYKKEIIRIRNKFPELLESSAHIFSQVSRKLYKLHFLNCAVEINSNQSMKFTLSFDNDRLLMITKYSDSETMDIAKGQIIYSFFINRKLIASDVANLEVFTKNFKGYISL